MNAVRFARDITQTGAPGEIRTPDPQIRSLVLFQPSLKAPCASPNETEKLATIERCPCSCRPAALNLIPKMRAKPASRISARGRERGRPYGTGFDKPVNVVWFEFKRASHVARIARELRHCSTKFSRGTWMNV